MKIAIIGGGASGLFAAIHAAEKGSEVTIFEASQQPGKKILKTGNGKCNITNMNLNAQYYSSSNAGLIGAALKKYDNEDLIRSLMGWGLLVKETDGLVYPYNEQASSVRDILVNEAVSRGVTIKTDSFVNMISYENGLYLISVEGIKERFSFDRVIIATGSRSGLTAREKSNGIILLDKLGIKTTQLYPGLVRLKCDGFDFAQVKGSRAKGRVTMFTEDEDCMEEEGELLFWDEGISGICILQLSRFVGKNLDMGKEIVLKLDLLPDIEINKLRELFIPSILLNSDKTVGQFFTGIINRQIAMETLKMAGLNPESLLSYADNEDILKVIESFKSIFVKVTGVEGFENSQVTVGGADLNEIDENMEVKKFPGLYIVGELLDVDGPCGGYNLQWAFTSGYIAGENVCS